MNPYDEMMRVVSDHTRKAQRLWNDLHGRVDGFDVGPLPGSYAFRISPKGGPRTFNGQTINAVSISYPPDKSGYIETALIGTDGNLIYVDDLGYSDVVVHDDQNSLVAHLNDLLQKTS
jgi:hypothetical protein